jgi:DNA-binding NarL/FixJ family response regulator
VLRQIHAPVRVLLADDHTLVRDGLSRLLREGGFDVIGEARDGAEAARLTSELKPDVLLLDIVMPTASGFDTLRTLAASRSRTRVLVLTAGMLQAEVPEALKLGAHGVLLKDAEADVLYQAVQAVHDGLMWVTPDVIDDLLAPPLASPSIGRAQGTKSNKSNHYGLNRRELQLVSLVASGQSNKEIASACALRENTVKQYLRRIFDKCGVSSRLELALFAVNNGLS